MTWVQVYFGRIDTDPQLIFVTFHKGLPSLFTVCLFRPATSLELPSNSYISPLSIYFWSYEQRVC